MGRTRRKRKGVGERAETDATRRRLGRVRTCEPTNERDERGGAITALKEDRRVAAVERGDGKVEVIIPLEQWPHDLA